MATHLIRCQRLLYSKTARRRHVRRHLLYDTKDGVPQEIEDGVRYWQSARRLPDHSPRYSQDTQRQRTGATNMRGGRFHSVLGKFPIVAPTGDHRTSVPIESKLGY